MNELSVPFLYMIVNDYIKITDARTTTEVAQEIDNHRLNSIAKNYDLFLDSNIQQLPFRTENEIIKFMSETATEGQLYSMSLDSYDEARALNGSTEWYDHVLFLDVTRDGMRVVVPVYKLFNLEDSSLNFNVIGSNMNLELDVKEGDKFLIIRGDNIRIVLRQLKKQLQFKNQVNLEHAGITSKFSIDQI